MNNLVAGPFLGEFGHEIMSWQAAVRSKSREYDRTVIFCQKERTYLYQDFADSFIMVEGLPNPDCHRCTGWEGPRDIAKEWAKERGYSYMSPAFFSPPTHGMEWFPYGYHPYPMKDPKFLIIHARSRTLFGSGNRNWPVKKWIQFLKGVSGRWDRILFIGSKEESEFVEEKNTIDMRGGDLKTICVLLSTASAVVGASSGPIHLAALCGCPSVVWTDCKHKWGRLTNEERLRKTWNPFDVPVEIIDGWKPTVNEVERALDGLLQRCS